MTLQNQGQQRDPGRLRGPGPELIRRLSADVGTCYADQARRAARHLTAAYDRALAPAGLRIGQFSLLYAAALYGPVPLVRLADLMAMDRTTLASNLRPLERDGLLVVHRAERDQRVREVSLSEAGAEALERALPLWKAVQARFDEDFGPPRADRLRHELRAVLATTPDDPPEGARGE